MPGFEPNTRARNLERLAAAPVDLLVVGGGITGAGVAREAALRGLSVAVIEARDFASGTSSRSSKLIHGGLRYLEQGEIALVREAATERKVLRRIAPHRTARVLMLVPVYGRTSAGLYKLRVGLTLFDKLAGVASADRHGILSRDEVLAIAPTLQPERLQGAAVYPEYVTDDARLVLDTMKAAHEQGAVAVNYVRVTAIAPPRDGVRTVELWDEEGGVALTARGRVIVNAAGPWVDLIRALDRPGERPVLHLTKGIHLVFRATDLPTSHSIVMRGSDGRPVFSVPRGRHVYVGTTDTSYEGPLEEPAVTRADADYLFETLGRSFPSAALGVRDVVGAWAGLRPLVHEEGRSPSEISRKDEIAVSANGLITIAGGKLTTYRRMAERVLDAAASALGGATGSTGSDQRPLAGGALDGAADLGAWVDSTPVQEAMRALPRETCERLVESYGADAIEVVRSAGDQTAFDALAPGIPLSAAEVRHATRHEMACTLTDMLERRSRLALFASDDARAVAPAVARVLAEERGWTDARREAELRCFDRQLDARLGWRSDVSRA